MTHRGRSPSVHRGRAGATGSRRVCWRMPGEVVARGGVEPPTYRFSGGRSYQLSYLAVPARTPDGGEATQTGLEPATFAVTGRRANQLRHWA